MNVALDTNAYRDFMRGDLGVVNVVQNATRVYLPLTVIGELRAGFVGGQKKQTNENQLARFLNKATVEVLIPDLQTTHHYAFVFAFLKAQGTMIPANDIWIAALVIQHGLPLCTADRHFDHLPQIPKCGHAM